MLNSIYFCNLKIIFENQTNLHFLLTKLEGFIIYHIQGFVRIKDEFIKFKFIVFPFLIEKLHYNIFFSTKDAS